MGGRGRRNDRTLNTHGASRCWRRAVWLAVFALLLQTVAHLAPMPQRSSTAASAEAVHGDHHAASDHHDASDAPGTPDPAGSLAHKCQICLTLQHAGTFVPPSVSDAQAVVVAWRHRLVAASTRFVPFRRYASFETRAPPSRG